MRPQKFPAETEADGKKDQGVEHTKQGNQEENLKKKIQCRGRQLGEFIKIVKLSSDLIMFV